MPWILEPGWLAVHSTAHVQAALRLQHDVFVANIQRPWGRQGNLSLL